MGGTRRQSLNFVSDVRPAEFSVIASSFHSSNFKRWARVVYLGKCARVYHYQYSRTFPELPDILSLALRSYTSNIVGEREEKRGGRHKTIAYPGLGARIV